MKPLDAHLGYQGVQGQMVLAVCLGITLSNQGCAPFPAAAGNPHILHLPTYGKTPLRGVRDSSSLSRCHSTLQ
jgi:hypothetical protein